MLPPLSSVRRNKATYRKRGEHRESDFSQKSGTNAEVIATLTAISQASARMAKNLRIIAARRQSKEGGTVNVKNERYGYDNRRAEKRLPLLLTTQQTTVDTAARDE